MKWSLTDMSVDDNQKMFYEKTLKLDIKNFSSIKRLLGLNSFHINGVWYYDDVNDHLYTEFNLSGDITIEGSLYLDAQDHHIDVDATCVFGFDQIDDVAEYLVDNNEVDLLPIIRQLIVANIPVNVVDENLDYPKGQGWEVIRESDFNETKKNEVNPKLAKLLELNIEDD